MSEYCAGCSTRTTGMTSGLCRECLTDLADAPTLRARVAELEAQLATARAEERERCAKACESFAEITRAPEGTIGAIGAYACAIIIRSLSPTPEPPHA